jgi:hypothetical protein
VTRNFQPFKGLVQDLSRQRNSRHQENLDDLGLFKEEHGGNDMRERESSRVDIREWGRG